MSKQIVHKQIKHEVRCGDMRPILTQNPSQFKTISQWKTCELCHNKYCKEIELEECCGFYGTCNSVGW